MRRRDSRHIAALLCVAVVTGLTTVSPGQNRPATIQPAAGGEGIGRIVLTIDEATLTPLKSGWAEYFGTHYAGSTELAGRSWNTVRSYGGTHVGYYPTGEAEPLKGPFNGKDIRLSLDEFHSRRGRGKRGKELIADIDRHEFTAIYLTTNIVRPSLEPLDKDRLYWGVRLIHETFPQTYRKIVWQVGNEVVSGHFDPKGLRDRPENRGQSPDGKFFGYDLKWKEKYYVNQYLAPAIEAIERASADVYGDSRKIQIALGSMNPYNQPNIVFLQNVMSRNFDSPQAPTLKGEPVWKHVDLLTVHYMTGSQRTVATLQRYHDDYLKTQKVKGIWITEDHGRAGRGPVTILDRAFRFLAWVAENDLSGEQTRLCWWGEAERDPGGQGRETTALIGEFFAKRKLYYLSQAVAGGTLHVLGDGNDGGIERLLMAFTPARDGSIRIEHLRLKLPSSDISSRQWAVEAIQYSGTKPGERFTPVIEAEEDDIEIAWNRTVAEPALLMLKREQ